VWQPFYEMLVDEMDFKDKMMAAKEDKMIANIAGA